jgi:hypothetical protein
MAWTLHEPTWDFEPPHGELTWTVRWGSSPERNVKFEDALDEWKLSMGCMFDPKQVDPSEHADLVFSCMEPPTWPDDQGTMATGIEEDGKTVHVIVRADLCDSGGNMLFMHAAGHGIGLSDLTEWYPNVMSQVSLMPDWWNDEVPRMERDGTRIWAHDHGAPGCGTDDPRWSWELDPGYYSSHPETPEPGRMPVLHG